MSDRSELYGVSASDGGGSFLELRSGYSTPQGYGDPLEDLNASTDDDETPPPSQRDGNQCNDASPTTATDARVTLNERFQLALEKQMAYVRRLGSTVLSATMHREIVASCSELQMAARDFQAQASLFARVIISEIGLPEMQKTIKPAHSIGGSLGGQKFVVGPILFKFGDPTMFGSYPDALHVAHKIQGHEFKGLCAYFAAFFNVGLVGRVSFPMMAIIDYKGHRITAMTLLPISRQTLIYGSNNAGTECHVETSNQEFFQRITNVSQSMGLKLHRVVNGRSVNGEALIATCVDLEGHQGLDGRHYLLDYSRALPPAHKETRPSYDTLWPFYHLLRAEFVTNHDTPLSPDAFSGFQSPHADEANKADRADVVAATQLLRTTIVERVAEYIVAGAKQEVNAELYSINISQVMHSFGLNLRYLGLLYTHLMKSYHKNLRNAYTLIQGEALMRVLKNRLRMLWRATDGSESALLCVTRDLLNDFFGKVPTEQWNLKNSYVACDLQNTFNFDDATCKYVVRACLQDREVVSGNVLTRARMSLRFVVLEALGRSAGLQIRDVPDLVERSYTQALVFDELDFVFVERIKQLNVVDRAEGMKLYVRALDARVQNSTDHTAGYQEALRAFFVVDNAYSTYPADAWFAWLLAEICAVLSIITHSLAPEASARKAAADVTDADVDEDELSETQLDTLFDTLAERYFRAAVAAVPSTVRALSGFAQYLLERGNETEAHTHIHRALSLASEPDELQHLHALRDVCRARQNSKSAPKPSKSSPRVPDGALTEATAAALKDCRVQALLCRVRASRAKRSASVDATAVSSPPPSPGRASRHLSSSTTVSKVRLTARADKSRSAPDSPLSLSPRTGRAALAADSSPRLTQSSSTASSLPRFNTMESVSKSPRVKADDTAESGPKSPRVKADDTAESGPKSPRLMIGRRKSNADVGGAK